MDDIRVCHKCGGTRKAEKVHLYAEEYTYFVKCTVCGYDNGCDWTLKDIQEMGFEIE